jgi:hypothetical protein
MIVVMDVGARQHFTATLFMLAAACGARSSLGVQAGDSSAPKAPGDAAAEESLAPEPLFWTFTTPGSAWALALDEDGNPFFAVHDSPWSPRKTTVYKLDGLTKKVIWRTTFTNVPVYSMAYASGSLYLTGVTYPKTHLDLGNLTLDLPAIEGDSASYIAKVDARDGRAIWAISPDVGRAPTTHAASKCLGIAAESNGAAVLCGYQGADFGVGKPYLTDRGSFAVLRVASSGEPMWAKAFSGDPVVGQVDTFRRPITFDANGDLWFAGITTLPIVDESSSTLVIAGGANDPTPRAYVVRVASSSQRWALMSSSRARSGRPGRSTRCVSARRRWGRGGSQCPMPTSSERRPMATVISSSRSRSRIRVQVSRDSTSTVRSFRERR